LNALKNSFATRTTMTDLSPAAQAVLDAAMQYEINPECYSREIAAAALRAAAKVIAPEAMPHRRKIRAELLAIAAELETSTTENR
jgi:hypothetical protein